MSPRQTLTHRQDRPAASHDLPAAPRNVPIFLDAHAHYYPCFDPSRFLDHAAANFARAAADRGFALQAPPHLVIASTPITRGLADLRDRARRRSAGPWRLEPTAEAASFLATRPPRAIPDLVLIDAVQASTAEGLEVLAIAGDRPIADGKPLRDTIAAARDAGAIVVIPWGFGKWWFARGRAVRDLLASLAPGEILLGDSAVRPRCSPTPVPLRLAAARGVRILPGTDPLPLRSESGRAGRYGCIIDAPFDPDRPAASLARALADPATSVRPFGLREPLALFLRSQLALRLARSAPRSFTQEDAA